MKIVKFLGDVAILTVVLLFIFRVLPSVSLSSSAVSVRQVCDLASVGGDFITFQKQVDFGRADGFEQLRGQSYVIFRNGTSCQLRLDLVTSKITSKRFEASPGVTSEQKPE